MIIVTSVIDSIARVFESDSKSFLLNVVQSKEELQRLLQSDKIVNAQTTKKFYLFGSGTVTLKVQLLHNVIPSDGYIEGNF